MKRLPTLGPLLRQAKNTSDLPMYSTKGYMAAMQDSLNPDGLGFMKMHGAGNDFVIIDSRGRDAVMTCDLARALGDRHRGIGFDQLAEILTSNETGIALTFWNADGSTAGACGNATRCVAEFVMNETAQDTLTIKVGDRILSARCESDGQVWVNMGVPQTDWQTIPLAKGTDPLNLPLPGDPVGVGMGNPHCVFFVGDINSTDVARLGAKHETDPLFPEFSNVEFVQVIGPNHLRMRVWERGTGITLACGSGACAALVAAYGRGLCDATVTIEMDGGTLGVDWRQDGVWLTGATTHVCDGTITHSFLRSI